jgi:hypothetical protein
MKKLTLPILIVTLITGVSCILVFQRNDIMKMEHWLELLAVEFVAQLIYNKLTCKTNQ